MKRLWIGIGLLVAIVILSFWTSARMETVHTGISDGLKQAAQAARDGQWDRADELGQSAQDRWQESWGLSATLADHTVLDEIDGLFAQSQVYRQDRDSTRYAAVCVRLAAAIDALQEGHSLTWQNLL